MPEDVAQYSSLRDDINRALQAAIAAGGAAAVGLIGRLVRKLGGRQHLDGAGRSRARSTAARRRAHAVSAAATAARGRNGPVGQAIGSSDRDSAELGADPADRARIARDRAARARLGGLHRAATPAAQGHRSAERQSLIVAVFAQFAGFSRSA